MPQRLPDDLRWTIVEKWLLGHPRSSIVSQCQISAGAVSSVVDEWRNSVGLDMANLLRGLAVTLRKLGMSPARCASCLRIMNLIDKMGMDANSIDVFLSEVYARLQELDISPKYISRYVEGLVSLVNSLNPNGAESNKVVSTLQIDSFLERKRQYNTELDDEYRRRKAELDDVNQQIFQSEIKLTDLNQKNKLLEQQIGWNSELRDELEKYGLDVSSIRRVVDGARLFSIKNHNVNDMLTTYSDYQKLLSVVADQKLTLNDLKDQSMKIKAENKAEEELLQERKMKNSDLNSLKDLGFGLRELKILRNLIIELGTENGQSTENGDAVKKFLSDIENHAYDYRHLRKTVENFKNLEALNPRLSRLRRAVDAFLRKKDITDEDVNSLIELIEFYFPEDMSSADSKALKEEKEGRDAAKVAMTHQKADFAKTKRSSEQVTDGKFTTSDDSTIVTTNTPPADEMHRKLVKHRFPRPLPPRKSLQMEHYETRKLGNGKVRDGHVTPAVDPNSKVNEVIRQRTDFTVDFEHGESSSTNQSSYNTASTEGGRVVQLPEGLDSLKPKKGRPASNPDITELMKRAIWPHTR